MKGLLKFRGESMREWIRSSLLKTKTYRPLKEPQGIGRNNADLLWWNASLKNINVYLWPMIGDLYIIHLNFFLWNLLYPNCIFNLDSNVCISKDYKLFKLSKCFSHVTPDTISTITSQNKTLLFPSFSMLSGMRVYVHDHEPRMFCFISFLFKHFPRFTTAQLRCQAHKGCEQCFTGSFYPMWIACLY